MPDLAELNIIVKTSGAQRAAAELQSLVESANKAANVNNTLTQATTATSGVVVKAAGDQRKLRDAVSAATNALTLMGVEGSTAVRGLGSAIAQLGLGGITALNIGISAAIAATSALVGWFQAQEEAERKLRMEQEKRTEAMKKQVAVMDELTAKRIEFFTEQAAEQQRVPVEQFRLMEQIRRDEQELSRFREGGFPDVSGFPPSPQMRSDRQTPWDFDTIFQRQIKERESRIEALKGQLRDLKEIMPQIERFENYDLDRFREPREPNWLKPLEERVETIDPDRWKPPREPNWLVPDIGMSEIEQMQAEAEALRGFERRIGASDIEMMEREQEWENFVNRHAIEMGDKFSNTISNSLTTGLSSAMASGDFKGFLNMFSSSLTEAVFGSIIAGMLQASGLEAASKTLGRQLFEAGASIIPAIGGAFAGGGGASTNTIDPESTGAIQQYGNAESLNVAVFNVRDESEADQWASMMSAQGAEAVVARGSGRPGISAGTIRAGRR